MIAITYSNLIQTCFACPEQWDANITDNISMYIRYRHGILRVDIVGDWLNPSLTILSEEEQNRYKQSHITILTLDWSKDDDFMGEDQMKQILAEHFIFYEKDD